MNEELHNRIRILRRQFPHRFKGDVRRSARVMKAILAHLSEDLLLNMDDEQLSLLHGAIDDVMDHDPTDQELCDFVGSLDVSVWTVGANFARWRHAQKQIPKSDNVVRVNFSHATSK